MELSHPPLKSNLYDIRTHSSSTPITIPSRRRPIGSWNGSPAGRTMSPDLIFDMSPVSSDFHSASHHATGFTELSRNLDSQEQPFMYSFPKFSANRNDMHSGLRAHALQSTILPVPATLAPAIRKHSSPLVMDDDDDDLAPSLACSSTTITKSFSTTKINGFTPVNTQAYSPIQSLIKTKRLDPPPRSSSYSSSPWIMPGKSDTHEDESGSLDADPSSYEFDRHLMRRIESQNPRRFRRVSLVSSIRV
ncbi:hypothetical protein DXG03_004965 [Asterophora parasitica]|uniref:Uncharacterized protein n=1 Tax=Asterophora parasitica TaxID=117018 RepID=A0A9P7KI45_9AGAR|nr:hypothetical protein DXG03_004965 [Asterophora parasitica]